MYTYIMHVYSGVTDIIIYSSPSRSAYNMCFGYLLGWRVAVCCGTHTHDLPPTPTRRRTTGHRPDQDYTSTASTIAEDISSHAR